MDQAVQRNEGGSPAFDKDVIFTDVPGDHRHVAHRTPTVSPPEPPGDGNSVPLPTAGLVRGRR